MGKAVETLMEAPLSGEQKKEALLFIRLYRFKMVKQLTLLGYSYKDGSALLELIAMAHTTTFIVMSKRNEPEDSGV